MALSGIFYGTSSNPRIKPQISWSATQSVAGNYSDVTAKLQYTRSNSGYTTGGTWKGSLTVDGDSLSKSLYMEITYGSTTTVITHTVRVYHNDDGKKTITVSAEGGITNPSSASLKTTEISAQITLDTIPRASAVSATDCNVGASTTVVVSQKDADFTHTLAYKFGSLSGYISAGGEAVSAAEKFSKTVVNFTVPERFYDQIPDKASDTCTLTCVTYQGSTKIGEKTATFTVTAPKAQCRPAISLTTEDTWDKTIALTGDANTLVLNASKVRCRLTATAKYAASVKKRLLLGKSVSEETLLNPVTTALLTYSATDSRGYTTEKTYEAPCVAYRKPTVNLSVKRDSPTADTAVVTVKGQCFRGGFGAAENTFSLEVYVDGQKTLTQAVTPNSDNTYQVKLSLADVSYQQSASVRVVGTDQLFSAEKTVTLPAGEPVFDWGQKDFRFHVPVYMDKGLYLGSKSLVDMIYPVGSVYISFANADPGTWLGGTWQRILGQDDGDVFLCAGSSGAGSYGGSANGLADQICVSPATVGGIAAAGTGSYKSRVLVTRSADYVNEGTDGAKPLSAIGEGTHYLNKNLPPYVKVYMWRRTA